MTREAMINGLRALADIYERHDDLPLSRHAISIYCWNAPSKEVAQRQASNIINAVPNPAKTIDGSFAKIATTIEGLPIEFSFFPDDICRKVEHQKVVEVWEWPEEAPTANDQASGLRQLVAESNAKREGEPSRVLIAGAAGDGDEQIAERFDGLS